MHKLISTLLRYLLVLLVSFPVYLDAQSLIPQGGTKQNQTVDSIDNLIVAIPLNLINSASTEAFTLYSRAGNNRLNEESKATFTSAVDSLVSETSTFLSDTIGVVFDQLNFRELEVLNNTLFLLLSNLGKLQDDINRSLEDIQSDILSLDQNKDQWQLTLDGSDEETTPEAITKRISGVIRQNDSVSLILQDDIDFLLTQSDKITSQQINLDQFSLELEEYNTLSSDRVLRRDMPAIWHSFTVEDSTEVVSHWANFKSNFKDDSSLLATKYTSRLILLAFLFVILLALVFWIRATVNADEIKGRTLILSLYLNEIFAKPIEVALLLGLYIVRLLIPDMPETYSSILAIIAVYAVLRVAFDIFPVDYKRHLLEFAGAYVLLKLFSLFYDQYFFARVVLLITQVITLLFLFRFILQRRFSKIKKGAFIHYLLIAIGGVFVLLISFSIVGNIIGILSFSEYLTTAIIQSTFLILSTYVGFHVSVALVFLLMSSGLFKRSHIVKKQFNYIFSKIYGIVRVVFIFSWLLMSLSFFNFKQPFFDWSTEILSREMHIGQATFSLINIILFFFVIWLSVFISRIVRNILQEEVFTRVKVERGVPSTVIMLVRITLIIIGFLLAAAAAGMKLSSLTIIIGAFSVGIGFGLQNIFNNLVSGLILAFERPIKEGDTVEVNALLGVVKKIGIRSSVVRTYDGAEVIVPNGSLISSELINWTLSDQNRRVDIRVGVAYGTDPEKVLEILMSAASSDKNVLDSPEARGYFIGFGDSSLDFRLLAWVPQEERLEVESDLRLKINSEIKKAGIEIPFPQQDLHVKSVDGEVIKNVKG
jgi:potassium-dependent mechanosensitive channel